VPKIAQLVEGRLHAWFDERCVEPRVQQIILPSLWPRKKNTRGGDENAESGDDMASGEETPEPDTAEREPQETSRRARANSFKAVGGDDSLDARMAAEGAKMRAAETMSEREARLKKQQQHRPESVRRRTAHAKNGSTEDLRIPGRFE
jgi:maintenance of morphology protein 1